MSVTLKSVTVLFGTCFVLFANDLTWDSKPMSEWDAQDATHVLTDSPWAKAVTPQWVRDLSPDERRAGGDMEADVGKGVGLEGLAGIFDPGRAAGAIARAHAKPDPDAVLVRWESARPVRTAEQKLSGQELSGLDSDRYYAIAVYKIAIPKRWNLEAQLKGIAALKRNKKKDLKPSRVMILNREDERATVVYLFPRSVEIGKRDGYIVFQAQIGRLVVTRVFSTSEMQIQGQLEL